MYDDYEDFADPTGHSALRSATKINPRRHACPTCGTPDALTDKDDACADADESDFGY
jgi:hypothetical protein